MPQANPWFLGQDNLPKQTGGARQRLLDAARHFHELQNEFYGRFVKAIRDAGYRFLSQPPEMSPTSGPVHRQSK